MPLAADIAEFYTRPGRMTDAGALDALLKDAPRDISGMVVFIQNLLLHVHWAARYGVTLSTERRDEQNVRSTADMLALMQRHDGRPLSDVRALEKRAMGTCRNFSVFGTALFRRTGIPALPCRLRRLLQQGHLRRPLGDRILERHGVAIARRPDRR